MTDRPAHGSRFVLRRGGDCGSGGCNDVTLAVSSNEGASWRYARVTTSSMPSLVPADNPVPAGFLGDSMAVMWFQGKVHVVWADTRGLADTVEEDVSHAPPRG